MNVVVTSDTISLKHYVDAYKANCPRCHNPLSAIDILWQGIHICLLTQCSNCKARFAEDIPVGQAIFSPCRVDLSTYELWGDADVPWFSEPLVQSLRNPNLAEIKVNVERFATVENVIILNCLDFLYGHCLLKLLNAAHHLDSSKDEGLVVIVPKALRWMVPKGVAQILTVDISMKNARNYYPKLDLTIHQICREFKSIKISVAHSHPREFDITAFTGVKKHDFKTADYRICFVWREDRCWVPSKILVRVAHRLKASKLLQLYQNIQVRRLFSHLRKQFPHAIYTVAGFGTSTKFPAWIQDHRVSTFTAEIEKHLCEIYAESRLVIGVHGSNMLLPSGHSGMTVDLMPEDRWGNFAQDILYSQDTFNVDPRIAAWRYRFLPWDISIFGLGQLCQSMLATFDSVVKFFEVVVLQLS